MQDLLDFVANYAHWFVVFSVLSLLIAFPIGAWLIARMPADYFLSDKRIPAVVNHWSIRLVLVAAKNLVGIVLIMVGILMLLAPGQGIITILAGLMLTNFPSKYAAERWLARHKAVLAALNWMRTKRHQPPFEAPE